MAPNGKGGDVSITQFHSTKRQGREFARRRKAGEWDFGNSVLGARQGEGQRISIGRVKYLFASKRLESETLYPSRTSVTRDTARVGSSARGWVRIKGLKTLTTVK